MDKLIGESIEQLYLFLTRCLMVLGLCIIDPSRLMEIVFSPPKDNTFSETGASLKDEKSLSETITGQTEQDKLPSPFSYLILLSLLFAIFTQYLALLIQTNRVHSFLAIMDSITFSSILAYTFLPFVYVFILSRLIFWALGKLSTITVQIPDGFLSDDQMFLGFFCYTAGFQMFVGIFLTVLLLIFVLFIENKYVARLFFGFRDYFLPVVTSLLFAGGFWAIFPFFKKLFRSWCWATGLASLVAFTFLLACPISLLPFVIDRYESDVSEKRGISIFVCDISATKKPCNCESELTDEEEKLWETALYNGEGIGVIRKTSDSSRKNTDENQHVVMKILMRNEGEEWYYIKRQKARLYLELDSPKCRLGPVECCIAETQEHKDFMVRLDPRRGEEWATVCVQSNNPELCRRLLDSSQFGAKIIFKFRYVTGQNLYSEHVSIGEFPAKVHAEWLRESEEMSLGHNR